MYWWLYDRTYNCQSYGCVTQDNTQYQNVSNTSNTNYMYGYFSSTNVGTSSYIWQVQLNASLYANPALSGWGTSDQGVRPVVEVYKANL